MTTTTIMDIVRRNLYKRQLELSADNGSLIAAVNEANADIVKLLQVIDDILYQLKK